MKANHIPAAERIRNHIQKLFGRLSNAMVHKNKQFYMVCRHCDNDIITVNTGRGHESHCPCKGLDKQIEYYRSLLSILEEKT